MYSIKLIPEKEIEMILPLLEQLNPNIGIEILKERLKSMVQSNYECVGVFHKNRLIGISGLWFLTKYYVGKHVEPDNVYIFPEYQDKGVGTMMLNWIFEYAKTKGCEASELNCYAKNKNGQKFWAKQGYELIAYHYQKKL